MAMDKQWTGRNEFIERVLAGFGDRIRDT